MKLKQEVVDDLYNNLLFHQVRLNGGPAHYSVKKLIAGKRTTQGTKERFVKGYSKVKNKKYHIDDLFTS